MYVGSSINLEIGMLSRALCYGDALRKRRTNKANKGFHTKVLAKDGTEASFRVVAVSSRLE